MKNKVIIVSVISIMGLLALFSSMNLVQKNPETIFFTNTLIKEYEDFKKDAPEKHILILKRYHQGIEEEKKIEERKKFYKEIKLLEPYCLGSCEIITNAKLQQAKQNTNRAINDSLMVLESDKKRSFSAVAFIDDNEVSHKKILQHAFSHSFWTGENVLFSGHSYTNFLLDRYSASIQKNLFPLMFLMGFLLTFFFIKNSKEALIIYLPCLYMAGLSLFLLKIVDGHMNMVTSIIPLVVFTICLSLSFHIYYSLKEFKSVKNFLALKWKPLFLMVFTTYIGFLGLVVAEIVVINKFGLLTSHLILFGTIVLYFWYSSFENVIARNPNKGRVFNLEKIFYKSIPKWGIVIVGCLAIFSVVYFPKRLAVVTDATRYFPLNSGLRKNIVDVTKSVVGMPISEIVFDLKSSPDLTLLNEIEKIEKKIQMLKLSQSYKLLSNNSLVKQVNRLYSNEENLPSNMPSYYMLRSQIPLSLQETYQLDEHYRISLMGSPINVLEYKSDLLKIKEVLKEYKMNYRINGLYHNLMLSQDSMIEVLYESFLVSALMVFVVSALYLQSMRLFFAFAFVNSVPVMLAFCYMYLMGYTVNIATVMTFSIALGLLGDSTFHISHAKIFPFRSFTDYACAVLNPVLLSGVLLFLCFTIFMFNDFSPIKEFGGILAFMMIGGYLSDLYILPTLIYSNSNHKKSYELELEKKDAWFAERAKQLKS